MSRREIVGWCLYDFAKSGYEATIQVVVFAYFFSHVVVPAEGADLGLARAVSGEALWGWTVGASMALVALAAPLLGAAADATGRKKRFLLVFCLTGCAATGLMYFIRAGHWPLAVLLVMVGNFGLAAGNIFYNAFLPQIAPADKVGLVSGWAWAVGYLGSALCLVLNLAMIEQPAWFGLGAADHQPVRTVLASVGLWWAVFAIPTFLWVRERPAAAGVPEGPVWRTAWRRVAHTVRHLGQHRQAARFLAAYFLYNDGIETVIAVSAVFAGKAIGLRADQIIVLFLAIQLTAVPGTLAAGRWADRVGHKQPLIVMLVIWSAGVTAAYFVTSPTAYWALCLVLALVMGGVQAVSRSCFALLVPPARAAEFFGFYGLTGKCSAILGPIVFGLLAHATGSLRAAVFGILPFFVIGVLLLVGVQEPLARRDRRLYA